MVYTKEMELFLKQNGSNIPINQLHQEFCKVFNSTVSVHGIRAKVKALGITFKRAEFHQSWTYSKEVIDFIRDNAKGKLNKDLAKLVSDTFNITISSAKVKSIKGYIGAKSGLSTGTAKRMSLGPDWVSPMKGKKLSPENYQKIRDYFFKKGENGLPPCPVGTERFRDNRWYIKIEEPSLWVSKARYMYEQYTGEKLSKDDVIIFLDKNVNNFSKDNLLKVSKRDVAYTNKVHRFPPNEPDMIKAIVLTNKLRVLKEECLKQIT